MLVMECFGVGARSYGAVTVSLCAGGGWRRGGAVRKRRARFYRLGLCRRSLSLLRVSAANAGSESCVAVKEGFTDDEDYIKGGGSELLFVQMQQNKAMEQQSKLTDKVFSSLSALQFFWICFLF